MSRLRRAALATAVVQGFSLVGMALSFVTVPLYLKWLGNERYGLMLTAQACAGYLAFRAAGRRWSSMLLISQAHGREDRDEIARIVRNSLSLAGVSALVVATITTAACLVLRFGSSLLPLPTSNPESLGLAVAIGLQVIVALGGSPIYNIFYGLQESHINTVYQGIGRIVGVGASLWAAWVGATLGQVVAAGVLGPLLTLLACAVHAWLKHPWTLRRGSFWDRDQIRLQYRTGAKSFGLQIGRVLVSSAPVFAISSQAGPGYVPPFTVALTLLNTPLNVMPYFNAMLQSGYGEAAGRRDYAWIQATIPAVLRNMILLQTLLLAGFLPLAGEVIRLWTQGKLSTSFVLLVSAAIVGVLNATMGSLQFALSGVNRHKLAGVGELFNGALCLGACVLAVRFVGPAWVGFGVLAATLATSGWIVPAQIKKHLMMTQVWPPASFLLATVGIGGSAAGAGYYAFEKLSSALPHAAFLSLTAAGLLIVGVYLVMIRILLPEEARRLAGFASAWRKSRRP